MRLIVQRIAYAAWVQLVAYTPRVLPNGATLKFAPSTGCRPRKHDAQEGICWNQQFMALSARFRSIFHFLSSVAWHMENVCCILIKSIECHFSGVPS